MLLWRTGCTTGISTCVDSARSDKDVVPRGVHIIHLQCACPVLLARPVVGDASLPYGSVSVNRMSDT